MTRQQRCESRISLRMAALFVSVAVHCGVFLLLLLSGGRYEGFDDDATPTTRLVLLDARNAERRENVPAPDPSASLDDPADWQSAPQIQPPAPLQQQLDTGPDTNVAVLVSPPEIAAVTEPVVARVVELPSTFVMEPAQASQLLKRLEKLAEGLTDATHSQVTWQQDGRQYQAALVLQRASDSLTLDKAVAEISAEDSGKRVTTRIMLKRLPFSHFTQMIDHWDPMVQLHDDEIVGRVHINSRFNVLYDKRTAPKFSGKVTTAAGSFNTESTGRSRESDIFQGGVETRAGRIALPEQLQPFNWAPRDAKARIHEVANDTRIRFFADGSYTWRDRASDATQYRNEPSDNPVYFLATRGTTLYVQGVVSGKVMLYSPQRIVVEGSLTYAHDPRTAGESRDYLGLVCDKYVEVASPRVVGAGDLDIQAAIFAGRRFTVTDIDHARPATLRIYGSLAAGSVSASEPRYALKIEYDNRFEQLRPPGFPSTNQYTAEDWNGLWTEAPEQSASESL